MAGSWDFGGATNSGSGSGQLGDSSSPSLTSPNPVDGSGFGGERAVSVISGRGTSAPVLWLVIGLLLAVAAIVVAALTSSIWFAVIAWVLGGPAAIGTLAVFTHTDTRRRANPWYADSQLTDWGRRLLVVLSLVAVGVNAWTIADVVARGGL